MAALADKAKGVDTGTLTASESITKMGVSMNDSMDKMKNALGELVQAMSPLLEALALAVSLIADISSAALKDVNPMEAARLELQRRQGIAPAAPQRRQVGAMDRWNRDESLGTFDEGAYATFMRGRGLMGDQGRPGKPRASRFGDFASVTGTDTAGAPIGFGSTMYGDALGRARGDVTPDVGPLIKEAEALRTKKLTDDWNARLAGERSKKSTFLESTFGKIEDFNAYATAFGMLTGGVTAAMDAWITGSMSAGEAVKKFIGEALKGLASQMAVEALKHGAYAIGSAAFGDFRGAGQHAAAAAAFGSGAAAAAVAAKSLGGSAGATASGGAASAGASGGGGKGASGASGGGSSEGSNDKRPIVVVVGDHFSHMSNRQKAIYSQEAVDKAVRERDE
jgi:hypothetical protein